MMEGKGWKCVLFHETLFIYTLLELHYLVNALYV